MVNSNNNSPNKVKAHISPNTSKNCPPGQEPQWLPVCTSATATKFDHFLGIPASFNFCLFG